MLLDTSGLLCLHHRDEPLHDEATSFFEAAWFKLTHSYVLAEFVALAETHSLCDAVSFLLMREGAITEALTTDRHFEQEGFVRLLKP